MYGEYLLSGEDGEDIGEAFGRLKAAAETCLKPGKGGNHDEP